MMTYDRSDEEQRPPGKARRQMSTTSNVGMDADMEWSAPFGVVNDSSTPDNPTLGHGHTVAPAGGRVPLQAMASAASSTLTATPSLDPSKPYHPEWGVMKDQDFHPLTLKHQRDLENQFQSQTFISDFYFWQANLGGYCMADMEQNIVVSSEGVYVLVRRMVEGAPHPGRRKKKRGQG